MKELERKTSRVLRTIVLGRATIPLLIIAAAVPVFFFIGAWYFESYFAGFISSAFIYCTLILALVILDVSYAFSSTEQILNRLLRRLLRTRPDPNVSRILCEEFQLRVETTHLKELLSSRGIDSQLHRTVVDEVDEAIRLSLYLREALAKEPAARASIYAVHVTKAEVDEEFNYWRSLKAIDYLEKQRELLGTQRVEIRRFFITDQQELTLKALAVIAHHNYWGVKAYWGVRDKCHLPIDGYTNTLLICFDGKPRFDIALLVKPNTQGYPYQDQFLTYWSLLERPSIDAQEYFSDSLRPTLELAHEELTRMDDETIESMLVTMKSRFAEGYLKVRIVRRRIPSAIEVVAVDLTSVKKSFSVLRQNPGYLEWQDACFRQILSVGKRNFRRCYVIDPSKHDTVSNFVEILEDYFRRLGNSGTLPTGVYIHYTSVNAIEKYIRFMDDDHVGNFLAKIPLNQAEFHRKGDLYRKATGYSNSFVDHKKALLFDLVRRDYLYTEDFIYDYLNPDAEVDQIENDEYSFYEAGVDAEFKQRKKEYERIYRFLSEDCPSSKVSNRLDVDEERINAFLTSAANLTEFPGRA